MRVLTVPIRLHPVQAAFLQSDALIRGFVGGRGAGKSHVGAVDLLARAVNRPGLYLVLSPTYTELQDSSWRTLLGLARSMGLYRSDNKSDLHLKLLGGAEIIGRSADKPERLRGPNLSGLWIDEASLVPEAVFLIALACLREGGKMGWLTGTFTPKGRHHWTFKVFAGGQPDTALFRCPSVDNPFLPDQFVGVLKARYDDTTARQELGGEFLDDVTEYLFPDPWLVHSVRLGRQLVGQRRTARGLGCDPGEGIANTAVAVVDEVGVISLTSKRTPDTSVIGPWLLSAAREHGLPDDRVILDRGGGGKQVRDNIRADTGREFRTVGFGESVTPEPRRGRARLSQRQEVKEDRYVYFNRRAEMYWELRQLMDPFGPGGGFAFPPGCEVLVRQLGPIPLTRDPEGRLKLLPKNKRNPDSKEKTLTELLGCSPDESDAVVLAVHAMLHRETRAKAGAFL